MNYNIVCAGTGGQGVLTTALILARTAMELGYNIRQSEVHGMAQRGGSVSAQLRIADSTIESDLIPRGEAHLVIGIEPLEALRFVPWLGPEGTLLVSLDEERNFPGYPATAFLEDELDRIPRCIRVPAKDLARQYGFLKASNMLLLGMAVRYIPIFNTATLEKVIYEIFSRKGEPTITANLKAFAAGLAGSGQIQSTFRTAAATKKI